MSDLLNELAKQIPNAVAVIIMAWLILNFEKQREERSNFTGFYDLNGNATAPTAGYPPGSWYSDSVNKRTVLALYSPDGANIYQRFLFTYIIK